MKKDTFNAGLLVVLAALCFSCSPKNQFTIEGILKDGEGKVLYLENIGTSFVKTIDSVVVAKNEQFRFSHINPEESPEFYRIRLGQQFINLAVDSTETIHISADTLHFATGYTVEGSVECANIQQITQLQIRAHQQYRKLQAQFNAKQLSEEDYLAQMNEMIETYETPALQYIYADPGSASAYFALFQQVDNLLIFNPLDRKDSKAFGAVANTWLHLYPNSSRTAHLVDLFTNSLRSFQTPEGNPVEIKELPSVDVFDFELNSYNGQLFRLSEVAQGKVTFLEFTAYSTEISATHNMSLAELYKKYHPRGFEIMQVSLDSDRHFWSNTAVNLPWVCVHDPNSIYSEIAHKMNIQSIPSGYLFDRNGEIVKRIENYTELEKDILSLLGR